MTIHIVTGPPCAGKSTFVQEAAAQDALIVDFDIIATALGSTEKHNSEGHIREAAFAARQAAINIALNNPDKESWIIHTHPTPTQLDQYEKVGAIIKTIDPGIDECLARAETDNRPPGTAEAIKDWYNRQPEQKGIQDLLLQLRG